MKTVLVTGANKGIGFATAKIFWNDGYNVILTGRNEDRLKGAVERLGGERCQFALWDISDASAATHVLDKAHSFFGNIDVFINNAGIVSDEDITGKDFLLKTEKAWDETMATNLKGMFFALQAETKYMIEKHVRGNIVNVCSEMGFRAASDAYCISKWGVRGMTVGVARHIAKYGIVLNGIAPGETATEIFRRPEGELVEIDSPRGKRAMPEEIAKAIFFLANARNIIGEILVSDGGRRLN